MPRTAQLSLPLVMPAQAQKHVTVNQAFSILDTVTQLGVKSSVASSPPDAPTGGDAFIVPAGATGEWQGRSGSVAVWTNGGWTYLNARPGWKAWDENLSGWQVFDGSTWIWNALATSTGGAALSARTLAFDHAFGAGLNNITSVVIPGGSQVIGVSGRVVEPISGSSLTGWRVGVQGADNRYGSRLGVALNSSLAGLSGSPVTYYSETPLLLTAEGGSFAAGKVRLAIHLMEITAPSPV